MAVIAILIIAAILATLDIKYGGGGLKDSTGPH